MEKTMDESPRRSDYSLISMVPGLQFQFRAPSLVGSAGDYPLPGPAKYEEHRAFFYNAKSPLGNNRDTLDVSASTLIVMGKFDDRVVCQFVPALDSQGKAKEIGHDRQLLVINFYERWNQGLMMKDIQVIGKNLELFYQLAYIDPVSGKQVTMATWTKPA